MSGLCVGVGSGAAEDYISDLGLTSCFATETRSSGAKGLRRTRTEPCVRSASILAAGSFLAAVRTTGIFEVFGIAFRQWHASRPQPGASRRPSR